jgi:hypothetical protein
LSQTIIILIAVVTTFTIWEIRKMSVALDRLTAAVANLTAKANSAPPTDGATAAELDALSNGIDATTGISTVTPAA